jgi:hypothetical protein
MCWTVEEWNELKLSTDECRFLVLATKWLNEWMKEEGEYYWQRFFTINEGRWSKQ